MTFAQTNRIQHLPVGSDVVVSNQIVSSIVTLNYGFWEVTDPPVGGKEIGYGQRVPYNTGMGELIPVMQNDLGSFMVSWMNGAFPDGALHVPDKTGLEKRRFRSGMNAYDKDNSGFIGANSEVFSFYQNPDESWSPPVWAWKLDLDVFKSSEPVYAPGVNWVRGVIVGSNGIETAIVFDELTRNGSTCESVSNLFGNNMIYLSPSLATAVFVRKFPADFPESYWDLIYSKATNGPSLDFDRFDALTGDLIESVRPTVTTIAIKPIEGGVELAVSGVSTNNVVVEFSTDNKNWLPVVNTGVMGSDGVYRVTDSDATNALNLIRFYRARTL
jgi:hypothetical protein